MTRPTALVRRPGPRLADGLFLQTFLAKGRYTPYLERVPVRVILNDRAALLGAARRAATL